MNGPGYLGPPPQVGMSLNQYDARLNQAAVQCEQSALSATERAEMERVKAMYAKQARSEEMMDIARQLENVRQRLVHIDAMAEARVLNGVVSDLVLRWNEDRGR